MPLHDIIPILQVAIGPVILVSGVGLLLLTMTNRFGRIIDRTRQLSKELRTATGDDHPRALAQLKILLVRAQLVRAALALASTSVLLAAVLIIVLFLAALFQVPSATPVVVLFVACMASLIFSLSFFIRDINLSLRALKLELEPVEGLGNP